MSDYVRITDRKIELTDEGVEALMSDYTPTTEDIREWADIDNDEDSEAFDRWLAEVKAQAWEEGYEQSDSDDYSGQPNSANPYRQGETE